MTETENKYFLWGEIPDSDESSINLTPSEKEALLKISRPLTDQIDGPKFHSPLTTMKEIKMESQTDPLVTNTIHLMEYKRVLEKLLETVSNYKAAIANGTLDKMPACQPAPEMPNIVEFQQSDHASDDQSELRQHRVMELGSGRVRQLLEKSVMTLCAHAGYQVASNNAVQLLTDAVSSYLKQFCSLLRCEQDRRLEAAPDNNDGWSDALENVCVQMRVGNNALESHKYSVLALGEYYQDTVIKRHKKLAKEVKQMTAQYEAGTSSWGQDDIPEMHFPSSDEGAGGGENYSFDNATPSTLDVGMQMLQSLEAGGELADTPLSGDSYNVETLDNNIDSPSPGHAKKRRMDSGSNKY